MNKKNILFIFFLCIVGTICAQENGIKNFTEENEKELNNFIQQENSRWQDFVDLESKEWKDFVEDVKKKWGEDAVFTGKKNWTRYGAKQESRVNSDFENGEVTIEAFGPKDKLISDLKKKAEEVFEEIVDERADPKDDKPILEDQLPKEVKADKIPDKYVKIENDKLSDGTEVNKIVIKIPFQEDHLIKRVQTVLPYVNEYSKKYNLDPKLVLAIIHTESAFNPKARSTFIRKGGEKGHAYGLMQLVPYSGGFEANKYLGNFGKPSVEDLYKRDQNILLGTTYLYILKNKYFSLVSDEGKSNYLITSAYNTGPGNVAGCFHISKDLEFACTKSNKMKNSSLYSFLLENLPSKETKDYLKKVIERMPLY